MAQPAGNDTGGAAKGQSGVTNRESKAAEYATAVAKLNSPVAMEREEAQSLLANDPAFSLRDIEGTLRQETLTGEQRYRLIDAAKGRYFGTTRAAMGVQFSRLPIPERVVLEKTYPQFPSYKSLKEGDMIIEVEGEKLRSRDAWNRLGAHIVSKDPGEKLSVVVRRGEEKIAVEVELGSYRDLPGQNSIDMLKLERGWELRSASYRPVAGTAVIATGIPAGKWEAGIESVADQKRMRIKMQMPTVYRPRLIAGGEARGGEIDDAEQAELWNRFNNGRVNAIDQRQLRNMQQMGMMGVQDFGSMVTMTIQQEITGLEQVRDQLKAAKQRDEMPGNRAPDQRLAEWGAENSGREKMLVLIEQSIVALKAEAAEMTTPDAPTGRPQVQP